MTCPSVTLDLVPPYLTKLDLLPQRRLGPSWGTFLAGAADHNLSFSNWASTGLNMPRMFKDRPGDDPTRHSFAGEAAEFRV
jgi:hypothetical protein